MKISEGVIGARLQPGQIWIAREFPYEAGSRLCLGPMISLHQGPPENSCRPAVDVSFRSVAEIYGPNSLGVIMTGMGQDGLRGCEAIHQAGGQILVQDEASSVVWGMPGNVAQAGLAERILPLDQIGPEIVRRVARYNPVQDGLVPDAGPTVLAANLPMPLPRLPARLVDSRSAKMMKRRSPSTLSTANFDFARSLVRSRSGIVLENEKAYLVETRLSTLARQQGFLSVETFLEKLRSQAPNGLPTRSWKQ